MTPQDEHEHRADDNDRTDVESGTDSDDKPDPQDRPGIEEWYRRFAKAAPDGTNPPGQEAQGAIDVTAEDLVVGFAQTVERYDRLAGSGAF